MGVVLEQAHAKINLTLDVLYRRPDGYHEVEMVMQSIELADHISIGRTVGHGIRLRTFSPEIPAGEGNLAWRAAKLMQDTFGIKDGIEIELEKLIPVAAGLAGGSSDAAAVIRGINRLWELGLSTERMELLAAQIGSDVPFCIRGGTALARGRGEVLTDIARCPRLWLVLVKPPMGVSTAQVYNAFRAEKVKYRPDTEGFILALKQGNIAAIAESLCNVLEPITIEMVPEVKTIKEDLLKAGVLNALMSGSGPAVFGIAKDQELAKAIADSVTGRGYTVVVTQTVD